MPLLKLIKSTIIVKFKTFCKHSTLHGAYYFYSSTNCWVHIIWALIIGSSFALCCFLSHMIWEKFVIDPTLTVVESTHFSVSEIPFPAVAVCDTDIVYRPKTENITKLLVLRGYNLTQVDEFYKSFSGIRQDNYTAEPYVKKMHSLLDDLGFPLNLLLDMLKKPCNDFIVECYWRSRPHDCAEMFRSVFTVAGYCCQFDIPYFRQHTDKSTNFISGAETTEALDIIVNGLRKEDDIALTKGYDLLYVFDQKDKMTVLDSPITLTPDAYFDVNVYVWEIDSSVNVKYLALSSRRCILESDAGVEVSYYQGCMSRLLLQRVVTHCRCLPFEYTAAYLGVEEYSTCTWDRLNCIYRTLEEIKVDIREIITESKCYQRCDYVQYDTEVEFIKKTRHLRYFNETQSRVSVHFSDTTCMKYRREVLYTWDQMLANLGGIFGLCLGGSMISVIELIWFMFDLIYAAIGVWRKTDIAPDKNREKIFSVTQKDFVLRTRSGRQTKGKFKFIH